MNKVAEEEEQGSSGLKATAFRAAEKRYQFHKDQVFRHRKGRLRAAGYSVRPTDTSDLVDVDACIEGQALEEAVPPAAGLPADATAYSFAAHPGLLLVRRALSAEQQKQLAEEALLRFPEAPSHTNFTRTHGGLPALWEAAQQGLRLRQVGDREPPAPRPPTSSSEECSSSSSSSSSESESDSEDRHSMGGSRSNAAVQTALQATELQPAEQPGVSDDLRPPTPPPPPQQQQQQQQQQQEPYNPGICGSTICSSRGGRSGGSELGNRWAAWGSGPPASALLRKLRWATLGPPFDWTRRLYLRQEQYQPVPSHLRQLATAMAALAAQLCPLQPHRPLSSQSPAEFAPDCALVNYYYEGDTLGGHKDDAEHDLQQPIVSLSLGCEAVLLVGSGSRDDAPTPLLLRSGDAVVLSGPARQCYHGMPRVFTDRPLPPQLRCANPGDPFWPLAQHLTGCRINVSVRHTA